MTYTNVARSGFAVAVVIGVSGAFACTSHHDEAPPPLLSRAELLDPTSCQKCHADHYKDWSGSMHAYASDDPVFIAMNKRGQRETNGALGSFCVNCHAPMAVREGATTDGSNLADLPKPLKGITCFFCHSIDQVTGTHDASVHVADDLVIRGELGDPVTNTAHRSAYSSLHDRDTTDSSKMCGACHDIVNGHGAQIERTFQEWQGSVFAQPGGGSTCGQCHMQQSPSLRPIADAPNVFARRFHGHTFEAVDVALTDFPEKDDQRARVQTFLTPTLQTALCVRQHGNTADLRVIADNVAAGHAFPSGSAQDRRLWFEVIAYQAGAIVYSSGVAKDGTEITALDDADLWLVRDCMFGDANKEVTMFWEAQSLESNLFPAQQTFDRSDPRYYQSHVAQTFPRKSAASLKGVPDRVTLRVRFQPIGLDVLDDLVKSGDLDAQIAAAMPTYDLGAQAVLEWTTATGVTSYVEDGFPVSCVTKTALDPAADKVPAVDHTRCK